MAGGSSRRGRPSRDHVGVGPRDSSQGEIARRKPMRRSTFALFVAGALPWPAASAVADGREPSRCGPPGAAAATVQVPGPERQIRDLEGELNAAVVAADLRVFERLLAEDFTHTNHSGSLRNKAQ